ncbi:MAG: hypothetical protein HRF40_06950 [Nitrososphaera sp.]|jgi:hypothetical protein
MSSHYESIFLENLRVIANMAKTEEAIRSLVPSGSTTLKAVPQHNPNRLVQAE